MSLYTEVRHPRADTSQTQDLDHAPSGPTGFNARLAAWITVRIGSMWTVYICLAITAVWMVLGARQVLGFDPYPYPFLLFLGNVVQLLLIFVILLGQQVLDQTADRRSSRTYDDAEAILVDCEQIQNHLIAQDAHLRAGADPQLADAVPATRARARIEPPPAAAEQQVGFNGRLAARITGKVGSMAAFYLAVVFQAAWMVTGQIFGFDRYPYLFLLFLSSLIQLILMFVIMVGQQVIGRSAEDRAVRTYLNAEAVLHACEGLQSHLRAQDRAIRHVVDRLRHSSELAGNIPAAMATGPDGERSGNGEE
jgi:uncharacterized membrane protein